MIVGTQSNDLVAGQKDEEVTGMKPEDVARLEREMEVLAGDFRLIEESYGRNTLNLVLGVAYVEKLLANANVARYLTQAVRGDPGRTTEALAAQPDMRG